MKSLVFFFLALTGTMLTPPTTLYDFSVNTLENKPTSLGEYKGKVALVVNVASQCGYTPQYKQLQELYATYQSKGFTVLGFPSNDFGEQEPGTSTEIREFCTSNFGVTFPMFEKIQVKGQQKHPLYAWLVAGGGNQALAGDIPWNFEKFLINKNGEVIARFNYKVAPDAPEVVDAIRKALE